MTTCFCCSVDGIGTKNVLVNLINTIPANRRVKARLNDGSLTLAQPVGPDVRFKAHYHFCTSTALCMEENGQGYMLLAHRGTPPCRVSFSRSCWPNVHKCTLGDPTWLLVHAGRADIIVWDEGRLERTLLPDFRANDWTLRGDEIYYRTAERTWRVLSWRTKCDRLLAGAGGYLVGATDDFIVFQSLIHDHTSVTRVFDRRTTRLLSAKKQRTTFFTSHYRTLRDGTLIACGYRTVWRFNPIAKRFQRVLRCRDKIVDVVALEETAGCAILVGAKIVVLH